MKRLRRIAASVVLVVSSAWGQNETPARPRVSVTFRVVGLQEEANLQLGFRQDGELKPLVIPAYQPSEAYRYAGPPGMEIGRLAGAVGAKEAPVATVVFEPSVKRATVLLVPSGGRYRAVVIPDDGEQFPPRHALLVNLAKTRLSIVCNQKETVLLAPNERRLLPANSRGELDADVSVEKGGRWQSSERSYVPVLPGRQTIIAFIANPAGGGGVEMVVLRQTPGDAGQP